MDHISIIIVNYNTPQDTKECLQSLATIKAEGFSYNIIVVDNGSKKPFQLTRSLQSSPVEVIRSESNLGFTGGNNLGISHAIKQYQSDYLLLLNSDTVVDPQFLTELYSHLEANEAAGMATPKIYFYKGNEFFAKDYSRHQKGKVFWYAGGSIDWDHLSAFHRGVDELDKGQFDTQQTTDFATGCCLLIKREVIEQIGILDKKFFLYWEDVDYSIRAQRAGFSLLFVPQSVIWHKNAGSSEGAGSKIHQYYQTRNRLLLAFKHGSARHRLTATRVMLQLLTTGSSAERQAVIDFFLNRYGKQAVV